MIPARVPISPWVKDTPYSRLNYAHGLAMVRNHPSILSNNTSSSLDNLTNSSSTEPYNNWETPLLKVKCYSSDTSLKNFRRPDKKLSKPAPPSDTRRESRCWPPVPSPLPAKPWMLLSSALNKPEPTTPFTRFYFAKLFGMSVTTKQWSTRETASTASCKREDDHHRQIHPVQILRLPTSPTSWHSSTTRPCAMCITSHSSRMAETMTDITSEVTVFTP